MGSSKDSLIRGSEVSSRVDAEIVIGHRRGLYTPHKGQRMCPATHFVRSLITSLRGFRYRASLELSLTPAARQWPLLTGTFCGPDPLPSECGACDRSY